MIATSFLPVLTLPTSSYKMNNSIDQEADGNRSQHVADRIVASSLAQSPRFPNLTLGAMARPKCSDILPNDLVPTERDVICGRGKNVKNHPGNVYFRKLVSDCVPEYKNAKSKADKSRIVTNIIEEIRFNSPNGGFIRKLENGAGWLVVNDTMAREKIGQCIRDLLGDKYSSSTKSKKLRRQIESEQLDNSIDVLMMKNAAVASSMEEVHKGLEQGASDEALSELFEQANMSVLHQLKSDKTLKEAVKAFTAPTPKKRRCNAMIPMVSISMAEASTSSQPRESSHASAIGVEGSVASIPHADPMRAVGILTHPTSDEELCKTRASKRQRRV